MSPGFEMCGDVAEAGHLSGLRRQVHDRVGDEVRDAKRSLNAGSREIPGGDVDQFASGLGLESRRHGARQFYATHGNAACGERNGDAPCPASQLQRAAVASELC